MLLHHVDLVHIQEVIKRQLHLTLDAIFSYVKTRKNCWFLPPPYAPAPREIP